MMIRPGTGNCPGVIFMPRGIQMRDVSKLMDARRKGQGKINLPHSIKK